MNRTTILIVLFLLMTGIFVFGQSSQCQLKLKTSINEVERGNSIPLVLEILDPQVQNIFLNEKVTLPHENSGTGSFHRYAAR